MVRKYLHASLLAFFLFPLACKSSADEPPKDYTLLNLAGTSGLKNAVWAGTAVLSLCQNLGTEPTSCAALEGAKSNIPANNLTLVISEYATLVGTLTITTIHPDLLSPTTFAFQVQGKTEAGSQNGDATGQLMTLSAIGGNPVTSGGVRTQLDAFQADSSVTELNGTMKLTQPATQPIATVYALILKPAQ